MPPPLWFAAAAQTRVRPARPNPVRPPGPAMNLIVGQARCTSNAWTRATKWHFSLPGACCLPPLPSFIGFPVCVRYRHCASCRCWAKRWTAHSVAVPHSAAIQMLAPPDRPTSTPGWTSFALLWLPQSCVLPDVWSQSKIWRGKRVNWLRRTTALCMTIPATSWWSVTTSISTGAIPATTTCSPLKRG